MKIGVSGASGQLGRAVITALEQVIASENLVAISRTPKTDGTYESRKGDYDQPETLDQAYLRRDNQPGAGVNLSASVATSGP